MKETEKTEKNAQGAETQAVKIEKVTFKTIKAWLDGYERMKRAGLIEEEHNGIVKVIAQKAINKLGGL